MSQRVPLLVTGLLAALLLSGCGARTPPQPDYDPWQGLNRKVFNFNDALDVYALEPVARGWDHIMPDAAQRSISHFFDNLRFPIAFVNDVLQGKPRAAAAELARFEINTVMGGLGFFDVAALYGLDVQLEDTGQTFGVWGFGPGPYLVLPFFGPADVRDGLGLVGDFVLGFYTYFLPVPYATLGASAINVVNERSRLLDEVTRAKEASVDYYVFVRNAYVQHRWKLINDATSALTPQEEEELYNENYFEQQGDAP